MHFSNAKICSDRSHERSRQRKPSKSPKPCHIPRVLLLVETAGVLGRGIIEGIGRYAVENGPWSIQYEYRALDTMPPQKLKDWKGDGIITRTFNAKQAKLLQCSKLPRVELLGLPKYGIARSEVRLSRRGSNGRRSFLGPRLAELRLFFLRRCVVDQGMLRSFCANPQRARLFMRSLPHSDLRTEHAHRGTNATCRI